MKHPRPRASRWIVIYLLRGEYTVALRDFETREAALEYAEYLGGRDSFVAQVRS
jgi:hypothetical protein